LSVELFQDQFTPVLLHKGCFVTFFVFSLLQPITYCRDCLSRYPLQHCFLHCYKTLTCYYSIFRDFILLAHLQFTFHLLAFSRISRMSRISRISRVSPLCPTNIQLLTYYLLSIPYHLCGRVLLLLLSLFPCYCIHVLFRVPSAS